MELGIFPKTNYEEIPIEKIHQYKIKDIAFDEIDNVLNRAAAYITFKKKSF
ncbi:hypothetical protein [Chryseobacterium sp.]|uniref:hypothetical protein n=1 Tax=Chryseobacterium sp. TaxID=1871047 RepID=UPI002896EA47|nr:hypothetical protein [Chryseobacterium sp.]